jgi:outer membrane murein-binding lipoprotein Lpp
VKKALFTAMLVVFAAALFAGCNAEELKKLNDQVASLTTENTNLKAKVGDLEKAKADMQNQINALTAERDQAKKDLEACAAPKDDKAAKKDEKAPAKKDDKAAAKKDAPAEKKAAAPAGEKKAKFGAPKKAK